MDNIRQSLYQLELKIKVNIKSDEHPDGVLTKSEQDYTDCLKVERAKLQELFAEDETHWKHDLASVKEKAMKMKKEIAAMMEQNLRQLTATLLMTSGPQ